MRAEFHSISVTSTSSKGVGGTHVHLNGSAIIPLLAPHLRRVHMGAEVTAACKVGCKVVRLSC